MFRQLCLVFLLTIALQGCVPASEANPFEVFESISLDEVEEISILLQSGALTVRPAASQEILLSGYRTGGEPLEISRSGSLVQIIGEDTGPKDSLVIEVPENIGVALSTFSANISIQNLLGQLDVRSTAGEITLENFQGEASLWAGRGNIRVIGGQGDLTLIGEHGILSADGFSGALSMTTIMGTLEYAGLANDQNIVHLEVDHGPVKVLLPGSASTIVNVSTTSGTVICIGQGLAQTVEGCQGQVGSGVGELTIRTVSGRVDLRVLSTSDE